MRDNETINNIGKNLQDRAVQERCAPKGHETNLHEIVKQERMGIKLVPDAYRFKVELPEQDEIFELFDIKKKERKAVISIDPWRNRKINRYVVHQMLRLKKLRSRPEVYWKVAWGLMKSKSYLTMAVHKVLFGWHRQYPYWWVKERCRKVMKLVEEKSTTLEYQRVYLPKGETFRPLGVPTAEWRIYLHMYTILLRWYIQEHWPESQHGYVPGRGVITAWRDLLSRVDTAEDIWEFDFQQFFPNVESSAIGEVLHKDCHLPVSELYYLQDMFKEQPKLHEEGSSSELLDESQVRRKLALKTKDYESPHMYLSAWKEFEATNGGREYANQLSTFIDGEIYGELNELPFAPFFMSQVWEVAGDLVYGSGPRTLADELLAMHCQDQGVHLDYMGKDRMKVAYSMVEEQWALLSSFQKVSIEKFEGWTEGLPQGAPFSPLLSVLPLIRVMKGLDYVMYADDGIVLGDNLPDYPINSEKLAWANIKIHPKKSQWVKRKGVWLKEIKFLGMRYNGATKTFKAETREGSTLEWTSQEQFMLWLKENLNKVKITGRPSAKPQTKKGIISYLEEELSDFRPEYTNWQWQFKSRSLGFIFSRLQGGKWNDTIAQDFRMKYNKGSFMDCRMAAFLRKECISRRVDIFNSSTMAASCLMDDLSSPDRKPWRDREYASSAKQILSGLVRTMSKINKIYGKWRAISKRRVVNSNKQKRTQ